jgi:uncharacterized protein (DUF2235 family)
MGRKLVLLFDGTWNTVKDRTNISRLRELLADTAPDGGKQIPFYDKGVGTHPLDRLSGGLFGYGLSENIRDGYLALAAAFHPGDELYLFGFSRGAYTARSLAGLIRKCGVLRTPDKNLMHQAYDLYRDKNQHPDFADPRAFRASFSHETRIKFIGVWDTVGSLGVPLSGVPFSRDYYQWHDTELSKIVDYAYHAIAIDEYREDLAPAVWTAAKPENREVEQRWFIGAHSNVGGGYPHDRLVHLPLAWMLEKAGACGLGFKKLVAVDPGKDHLAPIADSFSEFAYGLYKLLKKGKRYIRPFGRGVNETIDASVWKRWDAKPGYRPPAVAAQRR